MKKILIIEDEENLGKNIQSALNQEGFKTHWSKSLSEARSELPRFEPDLILLDWMLPDGQGIDLLREVRGSKPTLPVILLTARSDVIDKVLGLEMGANDYLTKPVDPRELVARIRARLREVTAQASAAPPVAPSQMLNAGPIQMDLQARTTHLNGVSIEFAKMEFDLLKVFVESPNKVFSREELLNKVWGYQNYPTTRTVDTHILQLRQKLGEQFFETLRGVGYRLKI